MKAAIRISFLGAALLTACLGTVSCEKETLNPESVIRVAQTQKNDFDRWLDVNFSTPYNIDFKYRYELNESDLNYFTIPADYNCSIMMAHLVKYLCIESYDEVAGVTFTRTYFPKMFFLTGEWEYRNNGTIILGTAEGGKKIFLAGVNLLPQYIGSIEDLNTYYIKTIHHEFTHILNQTKDFPVEFKAITGSGYVADSWNEEPYESHHLEYGFITDYSQYSEDEDFAEMLSEYITHTPDWWTRTIKAAGDGGPSISAKLDIVRAYMADTFNIDIDVLRQTVNRRQTDIVNNKVDLLDITIK